MLGGGEVIETVYLDMYVLCACHTSKCVHIGPCILPYHGCHIMPRRRDAGWRRGNQCALRLHSMLLAFIYPYCPEYQQHTPTTSHLVAEVLSGGEVTTILIYFII
jgi:hypothetical protein